ncbi:hypothetical protein EV363DRAFT_1204240 [Boletus edulis]|nr:hypothetical protein EV363DRAFT_1204240 [Boletus edulis]
MAECGICLDILRSPVSIPCGHVHCERCLRGHISSGSDALKSACPTCRKPFHIATPDFVFVPPKYHDFILPPVRKVYMDIPSIAAMTREVDALTQRLEGSAKENDHLRQRCAHYKERLEAVELEKVAIIDQRAEVRQGILDLRKKYDSVKRKYREAQSRDDARNTTPSRSLSRMDSQNFDTSHEILPKVEEHPVSLQELNSNPPRPKRTLPRSRLSDSMRRKDEPAPQIVKRQRTHRYSDVGSSSQLLEVVFASDEDDSNEVDE